MFASRMFYRLIRREEFNRAFMDEPEPEQVYNWAFDPIDYETDSMEDYWQELIDFLKGDGSFIPRINQNFKVWWKENNKKYRSTGKVLKMTHLSKSVILIETTTGNYVGVTSNCIDLMYSDPEEAKSAPANKKRRK